ncbi:MAG: hypothetical protein LC114_09725 [Bryobacterales bacterium]|nr:hypothetical protein [Bryobacterales bacterium]
MLDDIFKEEAVVADDNETFRLALEERLKPLNPFEIQVVGGFVEKQQVRFRGDLLSDR